MFKDEVIVDGRGHLLGRLASITAKELLNGQNVTIVRCEQLNVSGSHYRNKLKWLEFMQKKHNTNPRRGGPFHHRAPSRVFWRAVRGMIPHKTERGAAALEKLKVFEGIPAPYDKKKRMVVPGALTIKSLKPGREFCNLGKLAHEVGWKHHELIQRLETARKASSSKFYKNKRLAIQAISQAKAEVKA